VVVVAKNLDKNENRSDPVGIYALKIVKLTTRGRAYLEAGKKVPKNIWAEIDQCMDEMIELLPNR
jgi:hypothetical protein